MVQGDVAEINITEPNFRATAFKHWLDIKKTPARYSYHLKKMLSLNVSVLMLATFTHINPEA
jgi:hypothetical protein